MIDALALLSAFAVCSNAGHFEADPVPSRSRAGCTGAHHFAEKPEFPLPDFSNTSIAKINIQRASDFAVDKSRNLFVSKMNTRSGRGYCVVASGINGQKAAFSDPSTRIFAHSFCATAELPARFDLNIFGGGISTVEYLNCASWPIWGVGSSFNFDICDFHSEISARLSDANILCDAYCFHGGFKLLVTDASGFSRHPLSGYQGSPNQDYGTNREYCHDPLCKRIARANKRPYEPVPKAAYLAVVVTVLFAGGFIGLMLAAIIEPKE